MIRLLFCLFIFLISCRNNYVNQEERLEFFLQDFSEATSPKLLFLFLEGCTSCHEYQNTLYQEALLDADYQVFLVTKSIKKAKLIFGLVPDGKVFFDKELESVDLGLVTGVPIVYFLSDSRKQIDRFEISFEQVHLGLP